MLQMGNSAMSSNERIVDVVTPLGDALWFRQMQGTEALSCLFEVDVIFHSQQNGLSAKAMLGKDVTLKIETEGGNGIRYLSGICTRFGSSGREGEFLVYKGKLRPWLWLASRRSDCAIFQLKTIPDIISEVLNKYGFVISDKLTKKYRSWEYCVQYQETDLNFVMRLMEHEGIYFFFEHALGSHKMVLVDDIGCHSPLPEKPTIKYYGVDAVAITYEEHFNSWQVLEEVSSGEYSTDDYNFKDPGSYLETRRRKPFGHAQDGGERYVWPGGYVDSSGGESYADVRIESLCAEHERTEGNTNVRTMAPGYLFTLERCPRTDQNREYLVVAAHYLFRDNARMSVGNGKGDRTWNILTTSQPTSIPYRPQPVTVKPLTNGPQTAEVVGPAGEEIYTDEYGRIKVKFYWDRDERKDENSSCWIRVASPWAGKKWGMIQIPRIGQEVVVDFIGGDPDCPIVIGSVYNGDQPTPYDLDKYQALSTWKSHTTPGGGAADFNELRLDDRKDKEQVFLHAQKRMDVRVKQNKYETVVGSSQTSIGGAHALTIGKDLDQHVKGDKHERTNGKLQASIGGTTELIYEAAASASVTGKLSLKATEIVIEATTKISLKVGGSCILIDMSGMSIAGAMLKFNSGGFGANAADVDIENPLDAALSDPGQPGYLDNLPKGGGKGTGRSKRHASAEHSQATPRPGESAAVTALRQKLAETPSGRHALEVYDRYGVKAASAQGQGSSFSGSKFKDNTMNLDPNNPGDWNEHTFVHEMNHAEADHEGHTVFGKEKSTTRADYVNGMINEEADGMALQAQYANEQAKNGTPMANPPQWQGPYNTAYNAAAASAAAANPNATPAELDAAGKKAGQQAMVNQLNTGAVAPSTSTGQTYPQYYDGIYTRDNAHP
jgi:type VI secretion system secreted protein VgrG